MKLALNVWPLNIVVTPPAFGPLVERQHGLTARLIVRLGIDAEDERPRDARRAAAATDGS